MKFLLIVLILVSAAFARVDRCGTRWARHEAQQARQWAREEARAARSEAIEYRREAQRYAMEARRAAVRERQEMRDTFRHDYADHTGMRRIY